MDGVPDAAETVEMASDSESLESPPAAPQPSPPPRAPRPAPLRKGRGVDERLIACVRARRMLYDPAHLHYMDTELKNEQWTNIGKILRADPAACKMRWNNIRDNYHRANRKRMLNGSHMYKFGRLLTFLDPYYKSRSDLPTGRRPDPKQSDESEDEKVNQQEPIIKIDASEEDRSELADSIVEYDLFDKSVAVSVNPSQAQAVDAFLAALAPPLKGLSPYLLSLAKAEIFATVHKYELKGIVEGGWPPSSCNPLQ